MKESYRFNILKYDIKIKKNKIDKLVWKQEKGVSQIREVVLI